MTKPENRYFLISSTSDEMKRGDMMTREDAEAAAANIATDADNKYIFVAELHTSHFQTRDSEYTPYKEDDNYGPFYE